MPRPRHDSEVLPAKERLENAFWELLADRDYRKITVTDVVREAGVNRNSFYYHFSSLPELADSAILHQVESIPINRTPDPNGNPEEQWRDRVTATLSDPEQRQRLDHLALLAGPHSTLELTESLRDFCRLQMLSTLQRDPKNLDLKTDLMVEFTVGGMLAVLQRWPELSDTIEIKDLLKEDVAVLAMGIYLAMSQKDMLNYWNRIFVHNAQDSTAPGMPVAATHAAPSTISSSNGPRIPRVHRLTENQRVWIVSAARTSREVSHKAQSASHAGVSNPRTGRWKHERNIEQDPSGT